MEINKKSQKEFDKAVALYQDHKFDAAYVILKSLLKNEPNYPDALFLSGIINFKHPQGIRMALAKTYFTQLIEVCPDYDMYAYFHLGEIAYSEEEWDKAVSYLKTFLEDEDKIKRERDREKAKELLDWSAFLGTILSDTVPYDPHIVKDISTPDNDEYLAIISSDDEYVFFTRNERYKNPIYYGGKEITEREFFCYSERLDDSTFSEGYHLPEPFNTHPNEGGPCLSATNTQLLYTICKRDVSGYLNCDIYTSQKDANGEWEAIRPVSALINGDKTWESQPSLSANGKVLYFASDRPGGIGGIDIWYSLLDNNKQWGAPKNLGRPINTRGNEKSPFIHPDGRTLYFASNGLLGVGGYDMFMCKTTTTGDAIKASRPKNLGYPINTEGDESGFFISMDGQYGYFASNKIENTGRWNLYRFKLYDSIKPENVVLVKGALRDEHGDVVKSASLQIKDVVTNQTDLIDVDSSGRYTAFVNVTKPQLLTVKGTGIVFTSTLISSDQATIKQRKINLETTVSSITKGTAYPLDNILFETNSYEMLQESRAVCDEFVDFLKENPDLPIEIQGHTDDIGDDASNLILSERRAQAVLEYLVLQGADRNKLTFKGFGKTQPLVPNTSEENRQRNRRTVFLVR
ncbi:cell envelope biogenesis protein OmpA [Bacteroidia bacterium]|nr:cell envelope biogenesis protein OmpA [Bacteroidia bacterium]